MMMKLRQFTNLSKFFYLHLKFFQMIWPRWILHILLDFYNLVETIINLFQKFVMFVKLSFKTFPIQFYVMLYNKKNRILNREEKLLQYLTSYILSKSSNSES